MQLEFMSQFTLLYHNLKMKHQDKAGHEVRNTIASAEVWKKFLRSRQNKDRLAIRPYPSLQIEPGDSPHFKSSSPTGWTPCRCR